MQCAPHFLMAQAPQAPPYPCPILDLNARPLRSKPLLSLIEGSMRRVLSNLRLIDGRGGLWDRAAICIDARGLIEKVLIGDESSTLPGDSPVEDLNGATVLPGLIDCH